MIDLHSHVLPGIDDGSPNASISLEILHRMATQGITTVCASSHYYADENSVEEYCKKRKNSYEQLQGAGLWGHADYPKLLLAAEVAYFPRISECRMIDQLCIENTHTLLLEMPFSEWTDFQIEEVIALALDCGVNLILVHPERFLFSENNRRYFRRLQELPIGLQVNAKSVLHWRTRKQALHILEDASCPLLGSDTHNLTTRPPNLKEGRNVIERKLGTAFWQQMQQNAAELAGCAFASI